MVVITIDDIKNRPEADLLVNHIIDRRKKGLYSLVLVHGLPGTGKSSTCFRLKELVVEEFNGKMKVNTCVIENLRDIAKFAQNSKEDELCIGIAEELSTVFPSRRAMAGDNVDVAKILDTCRKKKVILIANAPIWISIDSHIRMMANIYVETLKVYRQAGVVVSRFYRLQTNPQTGKTYLHSFLRNGREVTRLFTRMPNLDDWKEYEAQKDKFMSKLYEKIIKRAEKREDKENKELGITTKYKVTPLTEKEVQVYHMRETEGLKFREIAERLNVSRPRTNKIYANVTKKLNFTKEKQESNVTNPTAPYNKFRVASDKNNNEGGDDLIDSEEE